MHERINAVVVARIAAAADVDELPPFLGVPCTIKESIAMAGMPNCAGLVSRQEYRSTQNAPTVQRMIDAGAIVLGVTNTPELCLWIETENRAYDRTHNAYSKYRTAGGSSGGEGAVVGSGGSPLGLGADIGGSIRLPAFFNGVFGLKPSPASCRAPASLRRPTPRRRADAHDRPDRAPRRGPLADEEGDGALRRGAQARAGVAVALEPERAFGGWVPTDPS